MSEKIRLFAGFYDAWEIAKNRKTASETDGVYRLYNPLIQLGNAVQGGRNGEGYAVYGKRCAENTARQSKRGKRIGWIQPLQDKGMHQIDAEGAFGSEDEPILGARAKVETQILKEHENGRGHGKHAERERDVGRHRNSGTSGVRCMARHKHEYADGQQHPSDCRYNRQQRVPE